MTRTKATLVCYLLLAACGAEEQEPASVPQPDAAPFRFVDAAASAGLTAPAWFGRPEKSHILESAGTGLALFDYDADGDLDLYQVVGWRLEGERVVQRCRNALYQNRGDGSFVDVTERAGVGDEGWGCGASVGDADGDGDVDLYVTNFGPDVLYLNQADGTFRRHPHPPGVDGWSAGAVFFDADDDGDEDLFVSAYIDSTLDEVLQAEPSLLWHDMQVMLGPFGLEGLANRYFENLGAGDYRDATAEAGLEDLGLYYSFAVVALDLDGDLDLDLYVANDSNPNYLYQNDGEGRFQEVGLWSGAAMDENGAAQAGMGLAAGDLDEDGRIDLFVTNFAEDSSTWYRNQGRCLFADKTAAVGLRQPTYAPLSWGTVLSDLDLDGDLDLFIANGHIYPQADVARVSGLGYRQRNQLFASERGRFSDVSADAGPALALEQSSRGVAAGDIDGDGDVDLVIANVDAAPSLLRNESARRGHWLIVDAPRARKVELRHAEGRTARYDVRGGSYVSASDARFHFGLGPVARIDVLEVSWPDGTTTELLDVAVDRVLPVEPSGFPASGPSGR